MNFDVMFLSQSIINFFIIDIFIKIHFYIYYANLALHFKKTAIIAVCSYCEHTVQIATLVLGQEGQ